MNTVVADALVAVQTLDKKTNDAIKRGNISQADTALKIERYKKLGANVQPICFLVYGKLKLK